MKYWIDEKTGTHMCEPNCCDEWLELIWMIGVDYDGCRTVKSLQELVDELVPKMVSLDIKKIDIGISAQTKIKIRRTDSSIKIYRTDNLQEGGEARK